MIENDCVPFIFAFVIFLAFQVYNINSVITLNWDVDASSVFSIFAKPLH